MFEVGDFLRCKSEPSFSPILWMEVTDVKGNKVISVLRCPQECKDARDFELEYFAL